ARCRSPSTSRATGEPRRSPGAPHEGANGARLAERVRDDDGPVAGAHNLDTVAARRAAHDVSREALDSSNAAEAGPGDAGAAVGRQRIEEALNAGDARGEASARSGGCGDRLVAVAGGLDGGQLLASEVGLAGDGGG